MNTIRAAEGLSQSGWESTSGTAAHSWLPDAQAVRKSEIGGGVRARFSMGRSWALWITPGMSASLQE